MRRLLQVPAKLAIVAIVVAANATSAVAFSQGDLQAKLEYCKTCHGRSGEGYRGSIPMPRLAGQLPEYLEDQLRAFIERRRENMVGVVSALNPAMLPALTVYFT